MLHSTASESTHEKVDWIRDTINKPLQGFLQCLIISYFFLCLHLGFSVHNSNERYYYLFMPTAAIQTQPSFVSFYIRAL